MIPPKQTKLDAFAQKPENAPQVIQAEEAHVEEEKKKRHVRAIEDEGRKFRSEWESK